MKYSSDASYVISGSDDTNLRLWKAKASEQLGVVRNSSFDIIHWDHYIESYFLLPKLTEKFVEIVLSSEDTICNRKCAAC